MNTDDPKRSPIELGWFTLCVPAKDLDQAVAFYAKLGFVRVGGVPEHGYVVVGNGRSEVTPMTFLEENLMNFRGGDIRALSAELESRGFVLEGHNVYDPAKWPPSYHDDESGNWLPWDDSGDFTITDPDGHALYFDSVPVERVRYRTGQTFCTEPAATVDPDPDLGPMLYHVPVADLAASLDFYGRLGLSVTEEGPERVVMGNDERIPFRIALCPGANRPRIGFRATGSGEGTRQDPGGLEIRIG